MRRVTEIIPKPKGFEFVPAGRLREKADFGTEVHDFVDGLVKGDLPSTSLSEELRGRIAAEVSFLGDGRFGKLLSSEQRYYSDLGYTGQVDRVYERAVIDFKTRSVMPRYDSLQLAAYAKLVEESLGVIILDWYVCEIICGADVKVRLVNVFDRGALNVFMMLLRLRKCGLHEKMLNKVDEYLEGK